MNRRSSLLALVAAGCGAGRPASPPAEISHEVSRAELTAEAALDLEAGARMWRALAPTGANYQQTLASIPDDVAMRRSMAVALLRQGEFACNAYSEESGCSDSYYVLDPLDPSATLADPCLRRSLALWSLQQLDADDVVALADVLVDLASMPSPEQELNFAAYELAGDDALRLQMLAVAPEELAQDWVSALTTDEARIRALVDLRLEGAASYLGAEGHLDALRPALLDTRLTTYTRSALLDRFVDDDDARTTPVLARLATDADCALAMHAARVLADRGDERYLPSRPRSSDPLASLRVLCRIGAGDPTGADLAPWLAAGGYDSTVTDPYGDPPETNHVDADADAFDDRVVAADWTCAGLTCTGSGGDYQSLTVTFAKATDGGLVIAAIASQSWGGDEGCGC